MDLRVRQLPFDGDGRRAGGSLGDQAGARFDRVAGVLAKQGATLADVVRITARLASLDDYNDYSRVRGDRFAGSPADGTLRGSYPPDGQDRRDRPAAAGVPVRPPGFFPRTASALRTV